MIPLAEGLSIAETALIFRATRNSGPGGQNVNQVATRIELLVPLGAIEGLDERRRALIEEKLAGRLDSEGFLRIVAKSHRTQQGNRREALERLNVLLFEALRPVTPRYATRPTRGSQRRRLDAKRQQGEKKAQRRRPETSD